MREVEVLVLGSGGGQTALTVQFVQGIFLEKYEPTFEIDSYRKHIEFVDTSQVLLIIHDACNSEHQTALRDLYMRNGQVFILVYSIVAESTFNFVLDKIEELEHVKDKERNDMKLIIVGSKCDLEKHRVVTTAQGEDLARRHGALFFEASARNRHNVDRVFISAGELGLSGHVKTNRKASEKRSRIRKLIPSRNHGAKGETAEAHPVVATKFIKRGSGTNDVGLGRKHLFESERTSLERLGLDDVDRLDYVAMEDPAAGEDSDAIEDAQLAAREAAIKAMWAKKAKVAEQATAKTSKPAKAEAGAARRESKAKAKTEAAAAKFKAQSKVKAVAREAEQRAEESRGAAVTALKDSFAGTVVCMGCGTSLPGNAAFCLKCGSPTAAAPTKTVPQDSAKVRRRSSSRVSSSSRKSSSFHHKKEEEIAWLVPVGQQFTTHMRIALYQDATVDLRGHNLLRDDADRRGEVSDDEPHCEVSLLAPRSSGQALVTAGGKAKLGVTFRGRVSAPICVESGNSVNLRSGDVVFLCGPSKSAQSSRSYACHPLVFVEKAVDEFHGSCWLISPDAVGGSIFLRVPQTGLDADLDASMWMGRSVLHQPETRVSREIHISVSASKPGERAMIAAQSHGKSDSTAIKQEEEKITVARPPETTHLGAGDIVYLVDGLHPFVVTFDNHGVPFKFAGEMDTPDSIITTRMANSLKPLQALEKYSFEGYVFARRVSGPKPNVKEESHFRKKFRGYFMRIAGDRIDLSRASNSGEFISAAGESNLRARICMEAASVVQVRDVKINSKISPCAVEIVLPQGSAGRREEEKFCICVPPLQALPTPAAAVDPALFMEKILAARSDRGSRGKFKMRLTIHNCRGVAIGDRFDQSSDPFLLLKVENNPDQLRQVTSVIKDNLNPDFDEQFVFYCAPSEWIRITMLDWDRFLSNNHLGDMAVQALAHINKVSSGPFKKRWRGGSHAKGTISMTVEYGYPIQPRKRKSAKGKSNGTTHSQTARQRRWEFNGGEFVARHRLGNRTAQSQVYMGVRAETGDPVVLKVFHSKKEYKTEVMTLFRIPGHENVVKILAFFEEPKCCLVMPYFRGGDLRAQLDGTTGGFEPLRVRSIALGVARGLSHMHGHDIVHRDLKSPNIVLASPDVPVIIDFGLGQAIEPGLGKTSAFKGTALWCSPEMMSNHAYSEKSDVFAVGIILWELWTGKHPYAGDNIETFADILKHVSFDGKRPDITHCPKVASKTDIDLMEECWAQHPDDRPEAKDLADRLADLITWGSGEADIVNASNHLSMLKEQEHATEAKAVAKGKAEAEAEAEAEEKRAEESRRATDEANANALEMREPGKATRETRSVTREDLHSVPNMLEEFVGEEVKKPEPGEEERSNSSASLASDSSSDSDDAEAARRAEFEELGKVKTKHNLNEVMTLLQYKNERWFHKGLDSETALLMLKIEPHGTFLFHDSRAPGCIVLSAMNGRNVLHVRISVDHRGFQINKSDFFPDLTTLVNSKPKVLIKPLLRHS